MTKKGHSTEYLLFITKNVTSAMQARDHAIGKQQRTHFVPALIRPIVQGSMGLMVHGVSYLDHKVPNPGDIDILISNATEGQNAMSRLQELLAPRYKIEKSKSKELGVVSDYVFVDTSGEHRDLVVQLIDASDFGLGNIFPIEENGIPVLPPHEALISLVYQMHRHSSPRAKDKLAFFILLDKHLDEFLKNEKLLSIPNIKEQLLRFQQLPDAQRLRLITPKNAPSPPPEIEPEPKPSQP